MRLVYASRRCIYTWKLQCNVDKGRVWVQSEDCIAVPLAEQSFYIVCISFADERRMRTCCLLIIIIKKSASITMKRLIFSPKVFAKKISMKTRALQLLREKLVKDIFPRRQYSRAVRVVYTSLISPQIAVNLLPLEQQTMTKSLTNCAPFDTQMRVYKSPMYCKTPIFFFFAHNIIYNIIIKSITSEKISAHTGEREQLLSQSRCHLSI